jgi:S1/P1 Nuclease
MTRRWTAALLLTFLLAQPAWGWDSFGHEVIARIAWEHMTPAARRAAVALLEQAPEDSDLRRFRPPPGSHVDADQVFFEAAATWADVVRDTSRIRRFEEYSHGSWHYIDHYFRDTPRGPVDLAEPAPGTVNVVGELRRLSTELADRNVAASRRAIDLAWVLHLVGDVHQPLHAASRVTPQLPEGDRGGNLFRLDDHHNLHGYWDTAISRQFAAGRERGASGALAGAADSVALASRRVDGAAQSIIRREPEREYAAKMEPGRFAEWADQSYVIAKTIYDTPPGRRPGPAYRHRTFAVADRQVALAGYRLAALLNRVLGDQR